ncbi:MAG TPA: peptide-methionine (R)-S-oxide reductase MsrB [Thermoanaerobaculia bacterium]|jgi:peptide-methionine (R)-S-oxide reductase
MNRRRLVLAAILPILAAGAFLVAGPEKSSKGAAVQSSNPSTPVAGHDRVIKTDEEWKKILTPAQYNVTRKKGTERAFTGPNWDNHAKGTYACVCCDLPLFDSETKFESGTGWPSFWQPIAKGAVREESDNTLFTVRTEVLCRRCDAHLGHVFPDGPKPTGLRYCMNGTALKFIPAK